MLSYFGSPYMSSSSLIAVAKTCEAGSVGCSRWISCTAATMRAMRSGPKSYPRRLASSVARSVSMSCFTSVSLSKDFAVGGRLTLRRHLPGELYTLLPKLRCRPIVKSSHYSRFPRPRHKRVSQSVMNEFPEVERHVDLVRIALPFFLLGCGSTRMTLNLIAIFG